MIKNEDVQEVLAMIDQSNKVEFTPDNLFQTTGRMYTTLKILYQHYKKQHELEIMQARIFKIPSQLESKVVFSSTPVSASSLFYYHSLTQEDIIKMIQFKDYLKSGSRQQLYESILAGIRELSSVGSCFHCYRKLLGNQFLRGDMDQYRKIQKIMIDKLLSLEKINRKDIRIIIKNILGLPKIDQPILVFISQLYDKIRDKKDFLPLFKIFEVNFAKKPNLTDYQALFRICLPQTLSKIKEIFEHANDLRPQLLKIAEKQAKNKLNVMGSQQNTKTAHILEFIVQMVKLGIQVWQDLINWESSAAFNPKSILKSMVQNILKVMISDFRYFQTVIKISDELQKNQKHSVIGFIFVKQLLRLQIPEYLSHRIVRKFLALQVLNYNSSQNWTNQIFNTHMKYMEVINEMFNYRSYIVNFYQHILNNQFESKLFEKFLQELGKKNPTKYKDFFIKIILVDGERNEHFSTIMFKYLVNYLHISLASSIIKDLSTLPPPKSLTTILSKILIRWRNHEQFSTFKKQIVRSLNIILCSTPKQNFHLSFQISFPSFLKEHLVGEADAIFKHVPEETKQQLKKNFQKSQGKRSF